MELKEKKIYKEILQGFTKVNRSQNEYSISSLFRSLGFLSSKEFYIKNNYNYLTRNEKIQPNENNIINLSKTKENNDFILSLYDLSNHSIIIDEKLLVQEKMINELQKKDKKSLILSSNPSSFEKFKLIFLKNRINFIEISNSFCLNFREKIDFFNFLFEPIINIGDDKLYSDIRKLIDAYWEENIDQKTQSLSIDKKQVINIISYFKSLTSANKFQKIISEKILLLSSSLELVVDSFAETYEENLDVFKIMKNRENAIILSENKYFEKFLLTLNKIDNTDYIRRWKIGNLGNNEIKNNNIDQYFIIMDEINDINFITKLEHHYLEQQNYQNKVCRKSFILSNTKIYDHLSFSHTILRPISQLEQCIYYGKNEVVILRI